MRRLVIVTGSRADRVPLQSVIKALEEQNADIHSIETHGLYGHEANLKAKLQTLKPDIVVLLGDRYETLVAASVAALLAIPIAHLSGGDETEGAVDNAFRHAITKLAYWHFPSCAAHARRIIQMGEGPARVFTIGDPAVDALSMPPYSKEECEEQIGVNLEAPVALVCYHPETLSDVPLQKQLNALIYDLGRYNTIIVSGANNDPGGEEINKFWEREWKGGVFKRTWPRHLWISLHHYADALIGNSSGFIFQGMTLQRVLGGKPKIDIIGERQKGRWQEAMAMFGGVSPPYPFGKPGEVGKVIANTLMRIEIPINPRKIWRDCN